MSLIKMLLMVMATSASAVSAEGLLPEFTNTLAKRHLLSQQERDDIFQEKIIAHYLRMVKVSNTPSLTLFIGSPGSGKSYSSRKIQSRLAQGIRPIIIDGDDFFQYHPLMKVLQSADETTSNKLLNKDKGYWREKTFETLLPMNTHIIRQTTCSDVPETLGIISNAIKHGYRIHLSLIAIRYSSIEQNVLERYEYLKFKEGAGRLSSSQNIRKAYGNMMTVLRAAEEQGLADTVTLYRPDGSMVYFNERMDGIWKHPHRAHETFDAEIAGPMTDQEKSDDCAQIERIRAYQERPGRGFIKPEQSREMTRRKLQCIDHQAHAWNQDANGYVFPF